MLGLFIWMHLCGVYNIKIEVYKNEQMEIHLSECLYIELFYNRWFLHFTIFEIECSDVIFFFFFNAIEYWIIQCDKSLKFFEHESKNK